MHGVGEMTFTSFLAKLTSSTEFSSLSEGTKRENGLEYDSKYAREFLS